MEHPLLRAREHIDISKLFHQSIQVNLVGGFHFIFLKICIKIVVGFDLHFLICVKKKKKLVDFTETVHTAQ